MTQLEFAFSLSKVKEGPTRHVTKNTSLAFSTHVDHIQSKSKMQSVLCYLKQLANALTK
jgi:hypothetical protein